MEEITKEEIEQHIKAMFDSVNLLKELALKETLTEEEVDTIERNQKHLNIMLAKAFIVENLTEEQKKIIDSVL